MAVELIIYEWIMLVIMLLTVLGFYDRIFFLIALIINMLTTMSALADGKIITQTVFNQVNSTWIVYTESTLTSSSVPALPILIFMVFAIIDTLLFYTFTFKG